ncbi:MAG TPA: hypothetical protein V6C58_28920 [Allocoleopsis sp.]
MPTLQTKGDRTNHIKENYHSCPPYTILTGVMRYNSQGESERPNTPTKNLWRITTLTKWYYILKAIALCIIYAVLLNGYIVCANLRLNP